MALVGVLEPAGVSHDNNLSKLRLGAGTVRIGGNGKSKRVKDGDSNLSRNKGATAPSYNSVQPFWPATLVVETSDTTGVLIHLLLPSDIAFSQRDAQRLQKMAHRQIFNNLHLLNRAEQEKVVIEEESLCE